MGNDDFVLRIPVCRLQRNERHRSKQGLPCMEQRGGCSWIVCRWMLWCRWIICGDCAMNCTWETYGKADKRGWRRVRCVRCGLVTAPTPHDNNRIHSTCRKPPSAWDWGYWIGIALSMAGITKDRVAAVSGGKKCGCNKRQSTLDGIGNRIARRLRRCSR